MAQKLEVQPEMMDFIKAWTDSNRLKIIGALANTKLSLAEIAPAAELPPDEVEQHLENLVRIGLVKTNNDPLETFELRFESMYLVSKNLFSSPADHAANDTMEQDQAARDLKRYLNQDGSLRDIHSIKKKKHLEAVLNYIITAFVGDCIYTEKEINQVLSGFHADFVSLRRYLVDYQMLGRTPNGAEYWRNDWEGGNPNER